jgi:hypothetical protein
MHVAKRGIDASLCSYRVTTCRKELRDTGRVETSFSKAKRGSKASSTGTNDNGIIFVVLEN